jgi:hypothetical protein
MILEKIENDFGKKDGFWKKSKMILDFGKSEK